VRRSGQAGAASLHAEDRRRDICLLDTTDIQGEPAQLGKASTLKVGDPVYAVAAPKGLELSFSDGVVAQLRGGPPPLIQTTAAISPGSSGGGIFDADGRLVGLTTLYLKGGQSLNFAVPVEWIDEVKTGAAPASGDKTHVDRGTHAVALEEAKDWQGLLEWCRQWTSDEPENAAAWNGLGVASGKLGRYPNALEAFRRAVRVNPTHARSWYNLGVAYSKLARHRDAVDAFRESVRLSPTDARAWYHLGLAYEKTGNRTSALASVRALQRLDPALADKLFPLIVPR
jgi:hypothetical protein